MAVTARLYQDDRKENRQSVKLDGTLRDPDDTPFDVTIHNLSMGGFRVPAVTMLAPQGLVSLGLAGVGMRQARVVRVTDGHYGCEFLAPLSQTELRLAIDAASAPPARLPVYAPTGTDTPDDIAGQLTSPVRMAVIIALGLLGWIPILSIWFAIF